VVEIWLTVGAPACEVCGNWLDFKQFDQNLAANFVFALLLPLTKAGGLW